MKKNININSQDIYKIISESIPGLIKEDDFGLVDVPTATRGGHGGDLGPVQGDPSRKSKTSDEENTDSEKNPQPGKTKTDSAGTTPDGTRPGEEATVGSGESPEQPQAPASQPGSSNNVPVDSSSAEPGEEGQPEDDPEPQPDPEPEEKPEEKPEKAPDLGQSGLVFRSEDLAVPEGAAMSTATMQAKVTTDKGTLTIINKGISPESDILDADPNIIYTLTSERDGEKKSESFKVPFSVVRRSNPNNHFAAVLAHLKGEMEEREQIAVTPPDPEEEGR